MRKVTLYGSEARAKVLVGVNKIVDAVAVTLGPLGRNVLISQSMVVDYGVHNLPIRISKDGYTVARDFDLDDPHEKPGVLLVKECCQKTVDQAGDGTTSSAVLMRAIVSEGMKLVESGANPIELKRGIDKAVEMVVLELKKLAVPIKGDIEKIRQIATVSANNDPLIGDMIADAFKTIGTEGIIDIEKSASTKTEIKISDGYKIDKGWVSPFFVTNRDKGICEFTEPLILLYDKRVTHHTQVQRALEISMQAGKPILIICEDGDEEGLAFLVMNNIQKRIACCLVKSPSFGDDRREQMEDIAVLTGGTYISDLKGVGIKDIEFVHFGQARKVIVTKDETVIIGGVNDGGALENLLNELRMNLTQAKNEDEKFPIEKRIARLTGGVAVIYVGANTETEMKERMDRFDDSIRATKAAIEEGFIIGAGTAFLRIKSGNALVDKALKSPLRQICTNAGLKDRNWWEFWKPKSIVQLIQEASYEFGYNAKTGQIEDLVKAGIIDPAKVLRCALQNAASSATMILTSEAIICDTL